MEKLEKLIQDGEAGIFYPNGNIIYSKEITPLGKIKTIVVKNPCNIKEHIDELTARDSTIIPKNANAYLVSDWNPDTQHIRKDDSKNKGEIYSVFAIQFYYVFKPYSE